ncbi:MAG: hypothetical protein ACLQVD_04445 [Capsulimonadaceae bacterium]
MSSHRKPGGVPPAYAISITGIGLACVPLAALLLLTVVRSLHWPLLHDSAAMSYEAWLISRGEAPYRDFVEANFPAILAVHLFEQRIFGLSDAGWRLYDLTLLLVTDVFLWRVCARRGRAAAALAVLLYSSFHLFNGADQAGQRDYVMFLLLIGGTDLFVRSFAGLSVGPPEAASNPASRAGTVRAGQLAAAGAALGFAASIKPFAVVYLLALLVIGLHERRRAGKSLDLVSVAPALLGGAMVAVTLPFVWLATLGGWHAFVVDAVPCARLYVGQGRFDLIEITQGRRHLLGPCLAVLLTAWPWSRVRAEQTDVTERVLLAGALFGLVNFFGQGKGYLYHLYPLIGFTAALAGIGFGFAERESASMRYCARAAALALVIGLVYHYHEVPLTNKAVVSTPLADQLAADLRTYSQSSPGGRGSVQVLATSTDALLALLRDRTHESTRFVCDYPLTGDPRQALVRRMRRDFIGEMTKAPPQCLVIFRQGFPAGDYGRYAGFVEFQSLLARRYRLAVERPAYRVYVRRNGSETQPPE